MPASHAAAISVTSTQDQASRDEPWSSQGRLFPNQSLISPVQSKKMRTKNIILVAQPLPGWGGTKKYYKNCVVSYHLPRQSPSLAPFPVSQSHNLNKKSKFVEKKKSRKKAARLGMSYRALMYFFPFSSIGPPEPLHVASQ